MTSSIVRSICLSLGAEFPANTVELRFPPASRVSAPSPNRSPPFSVVQEETLRLRHSTC